MRYSLTWCVLPLTVFLGGCDLPEAAPDSVPATAVETATDPGEPYQPPVPRIDIRIPGPGAVGARESGRATLIYDGRLTCEMTQPSLPGFTGSGVQRDFVIGELFAPLAALIVARGTDGLPVPGAPGPWAILYTANGDIHIPGGPTFTDATSPIARDLRAWLDAATSDKCLPFRE